MESQRRRPAGDMLAERATTWPEAATPVARFFASLLRAADLVLKQTSAHVAGHGLSFTEFEALAALRSAPRPHELTPGEVRERLLITSGGVSKVLSSLAERGLLARPHGGGDRRVKPVRLTDAGRARVERAMAEVLEADASLIEGALTEPEKKRLTEVVSRLIAKLEPTAPSEEERGS